tara:strand:- start:2775 stop:3278 length:504 start_codon:yes stop_codon:yes gene_type:complete
MSESNSSIIDVAILGGGPAGLAAALALGRACKKVVLFDAKQPPRNAAATHIHNFVTRDGTPPSEFRKIGREQLTTYPSVTVRDEHVVSITGARDAFVISTSSSTFDARRIILCTGMIDEELDIPGFSDVWEHSIFQCPYCHGWRFEGVVGGTWRLNRVGLRMVSPRC